MRHQYSSLFEFIWIFNHRYTASTEVDDQPCWRRQRHKKNETEKKVFNSTPVLSPRSRLAHFSPDDDFQLSHDASALKSNQKRSHSQRQLKILKLSLLIVKRRNQQQQLKWKDEEKKSFIFIHRTATRWFGAELWRTEKSDRDNHESSI